MLCSFPPEQLSISEVDEVICTYLMDQSEKQHIMPSIPHTQQHLPIKNDAPHVVIVEQPATRKLRFRYECEGRSAGSIVGENSTQENKTYPTIKVINYQGPFAVVVSAVTKDGPPYKPHPHNLVGRENCKKGVCTKVENNPSMICSFSSLGIQCVKRKGIEKSLVLREQHMVDPFGTGFAHRSQPASIDLNVVRLCFQVFIKGTDNAFSRALAPVVSVPIYDRKAMSDLTIMKLSHCTAPVSGGTEVILLCDRVAKEDIQVWFYEEQGTHVTWECPAEFQPSDVHKQVAIVFRTPRYYNENILQPVPVFVELRRPSDNFRGDPRPFHFIPRERDPEGLARKRLKIEENCLEQYLQASALGGAHMAQERPPPIGVPRTMMQSVPQQVKAEPVLGATGGDTFPGVMTLPPQYITATGALPPVSAESVSHFTPVHSPGIARSPDNRSIASSVSPPAPTYHTLGPSYPQAISPAAQSPLTEQDSPAPGTISEDESVITKFDSLGLDIDVKELTDFNLPMAENLSASLFDSANLMESTMQDDNVTAASSSRQDQNMLSEESLNRFTKIQDDLVELSKLTEAG